MTLNPPSPGDRSLGVDPRAKILAALGLIAAVTLTAPMGMAGFALIVRFIAATGALLDRPVGTGLTRGLLVLPFAGPVVLFSPLARVETWSQAAVMEAYAQGWPLIMAILSKAYISVLTVSALTATTALPELLRGLRALGVPDILLGLLTFIVRYTLLFREQVAAMRVAIASRAPRLRGWRRVRLYGALGGNLFIRAYERGEQVYAAMLARGYRGALPAPGDLHWRPVDNRFLAVGLAFGLAIILYP